MIFYDLVIVYDKEWLDSLLDVCLNLIKVDVIAGDVLKTISSLGPLSFFLGYGRDLQKATSNFTTVIGQGAFGPVYRAQMASGETVAVKVLATDSKQGEKEFQTEVITILQLYQNSRGEIFKTKHINIPSPGFHL